MVGESFEMRPGVVLFVGFARVFVTEELGEEETRAARPIISFAFFVASARRSVYTISAEGGWKKGRGGEGRRTLRQELVE
jgi:hypothetical protein